MERPQRVSEYNELMSQNEPWFESRKKKLKIKWRQRRAGVIKTTAAPVVFSRQAKIC